MNDMLVIGKKEMEYGFLGTILHHVNFFVCEDPIFELLRKFARFY